MSATGKFDAEIAPLLLNLKSETELIPAIAQDFVSKEVLMLAWMNREALQLTAETGIATYWSRSRNEIWVKGATSGHAQEVQELKFDCDADAVCY
jgi:phosphoribosyl-AMP cyclohydrolase